MSFDNKIHELLDFLLFSVFLLFLLLFIFLGVPLKSKIFGLNKFLSIPKLLTLLIFFPHFLFSCLSLSTLITFNFPSIIHKMRELLDFLGLLAISATFYILKYFSSSASFPIFNRLYFLLLNPSESISFLDILAPFLLVTSSNCHKITKCSLPPYNLAMSSFFQKTK